MELSDAERCLLAMLRRSLAAPEPDEAQNDFSGLFGSVDEATIAEAVRIADEHGVAPLLFDVLSSFGGIPDSNELRANEKAEGNEPFEESSLRTIAKERQLLSERAEQTSLQLYRLTFLSGDAVRALSSEGIRTALLKGAGLAALYPVPEYRKSGDVDLLLLDPAQAQEACHVLQRHGFALEDEQHAIHHVTMHASGGIQIELHKSLIEAFDSEEANRNVAEVQQEFSAHVQYVRFLGTDLPVLEDGCQAFYLLVHMLQDFLRAGFGLKLLCDWTVFWNRPIATEQMRHYQRYVKACGLEGFSGAVSSVCRRWLGLKDSTQTRELEGSMRDDASAVEMLLRDVLDSGEFGKSSPSRMVMLQGTSLRDAWREFRHQTRLNFPRSSRCPAALPALWVATLIRFLRNNRTIRHVSTSEVVSDAKRRSAALEHLRLFQSGR